VASNNLKRANELVAYKPEDLIELRKCSQDPIYFIKKYCKIEHPLHGIIPFDLYPYQEDLIKSFLENRFTLALCSRQLGKCFLNTTFINSIKKPNGFKRLVLKLFYKREYDAIFRKPKTEKTSEHY